MNDDRFYLVHILERIERIQTYTRAGEQAFMDDLMAQDAVVRNFEVIGEASKRLGAGTRSLAPHIPWKTIAGFRDLLIHNYDGVQLNRVWEAVAQDLPALEPLVKSLLMILEAQAERHDHES